uniref:BAH domain-containing protein n=1 Tax=Monopterus albus TaxID=43700 RepID=A0A3Q3J6Y7_MONAL
MVKAQRSQPIKCGKPWREKGGKEKRGGVKKGKKRKNELRGKKKKKDKNSHQCRKKTLAVSDGDALDCCVLLTRLEEKGVLGKKRNAPKAWKQKSVKVKKKLRCSSTQRRTKSGLKKTFTAHQQALEPKINQSDALLMCTTPVFEARRRRMASLNAEAVNSLLLYRNDSLTSNLTKKQQPSSKYPAKDSLTETEHRDHKVKKVPSGGKAAIKYRPKKQKRAATEAQNIDWLSLFAPTPRRQAGLTAAALLKLTSDTYGTKRHKKTECKPASGSEAAAKSQDEDQVHSQLGSTILGCCSLCKAEALDHKWEDTTGGRESAKHALQHGSTLGFPSKTIKEEQVEAEVSSCYCCSQERCVEYSHPAAIAISPHTYTCFPGYYVHFSRPDTSPSPISPLALCPRSGKRPKVFPSAGPQPSGITHPMYCCTSVEPCYGESCRINGYSAYTSCCSCILYCILVNGCAHFIVLHYSACSVPPSDDYPSVLNDHHSPSSIPICPSPRILTGCPIPTVPPAGQSVPHVQTPLSDPSPPQPLLQVAKECPQSAKPPSGVARRRKKARQKPSNGWQPVGLPFQKEVFSVGEEALVLRKCFEGIQRDGELIRVRDNVLLKSGPRKKCLPYVAKISSLWEEPESGELMMSLFWYYRPEHTQGGHNPSIHCEDVNSVACIEDKCYVLTLAQYCRFRALVKRRRECVHDSPASLMVPPVVGSAMPIHHCMPDDIDPELVFFCRHVYDFRYGRLLKNLQ